MGSGGARHEAEQSTVEDMLDAWRARLLRTCCLLSGGALLLGALVFWLMTGAPMPGLNALWPLGLVIMALPWIGGSFSRFKSFTYTALLASAVGILGYHLGWAPGNVALSCFVVTAAGVLLDPRFAYGFVALQALALWIGGEAVRRGAFRVEDGFLDVTQMSTWLRITIILGMLGVALWALLRSVAALVDQAYAQASTSLALAERQLATSRAMRQARLAAERKLRGPQKLQALSQLAGGLAHLINNELTVVAGALHDLDADASVPMRRDVASRIADAVARAAVTIQQLLVFSRREEPAAERLDLAREVGKIVDELRPTIGSDVAITTLGSDGHALHIEPTRLRLLLLNLLLNAADALPSGGRVQVSVRDEPSREAASARLSLIVEDTGHGMAGAVLEGACDTFFTTRDRTQHAGLGLSVAASIAEQSGGVLSIESAPHIGTRVRVSWPRAGTPEPPSSPEPELLHPTPLTPVPPHDRSEQRAQDAPAIPIDRDRWKDETMARLARIGAIFLAAVNASVLFFSPDAPLAFFVAAGLALVADIVAGWTPRLNRNARLVLLFVPLTIAIGTALALFTFRAGALIAAMAIVLVWATMLGPWWVGLAVLVWFMFTLLAGGHLHTAGVIVADPTLTSMAFAKNWTRVAVSLSAVQAGMLASVAIVVRRAAHAIAAVSEAKRRAMHAEQQEEEEGARALLLEQEATRVERISVSGTAAGAIAHDLNNALQGLSLGGLLGSDRLSAEEVQRIANDLRISARYCAALVGLVGQDPALSVERRVPIEVSAVLARIQGLLPSFVGRSVTTEFTIEPACWAVLSENDLQRIVLNLAANARDAMGASGTLRVSLQRDAEQVSLKVSDSGAGMEEAVRARVFEPFFTTKPAGKGTGLGLHAVSRIMRETRGTIDCESELGVGTTFTLRWPRAEPSASRAHVRVEEDHERARGVILVAEDQALVRQVIVRALNAIGFDVREAADGDAAQALVESDMRWSALCIDGVMPGRATADVIDAFTTRYPQRPVLLCSGHLPQELSRRGLGGNRVILVAKPFSPTDLQHALTAALAAH
jgi:signal transduction histidine kinase/CheY-like chemotaxis protein